MNTNAIITAGAILLATFDFNSVDGKKQGSCSVVPSLSTNVVSGDNHSGCFRDDPGNIFADIVAFNYGYRPYVPATEWWVVTNVVRTLTFTIWVHDEAYIFTKDKVISSTTNWTHAATTTLPGRLGVEP